MDTFNKQLDQINLGIHQEVVCRENAHFRLSHHHFRIMSLNLWMLYNLLHIDTSSFTDRKTHKVRDSDHGLRWFRFFSKASKLTISVICLKILLVIKTLGPSL